MQSSRSDFGMSTRRRRWFLGCVMAAVAGVLAACQSFDVRTDWDDTVRFDAMKRFHFESPPEVEGANPFADNSILRKRVRAAI